MSDPAQNTALAAVEAVYFSMQDRLNDMLDACKIRQERDQILAQFIQARHNYDDCVDRQFKAGDPGLTELIEKANRSAAEIKAMDMRLSKITEVIRTVATAASYGVKIAQKVLPG